MSLLTRWLKCTRLVVQAGVHRASSIKVAEAAKVIENTQRDLNIALMNELSIIFDRLGINTYDVLEAAGTKWNFLKFSPGLLGGHCIGVDPYYLTYKAAEVGFNSRVILAGRYINDNMPNYLHKKVLQHVIKHNNDNVKDSKVLVMGATFKEDVADVRNSKVARCGKESQSYNIPVDVIDPHANSEELDHEYGFTLTKEIGKDYAYDDAFFASITKPDALIADLKGVYRGKVSSRHYFCF
jgi:UDP-N-acetyl-D-galactosamine dehydrogenase